MTGTERSEYDVVIVGGGMVGASLACMLQQAGVDMNVLLLESRPIGAGPASQPSFDVRSTALSQDTADHLRRLGLWDALRDHAQPIRRIEVSDQGRFGGARLDCAEEGLDALGHVVENRLLGQAMNARLQTLDRVEILSPARVAALTRTEGGFRVAYDADGDDGEVAARLVVLAEGGRSGLCDALGIHRRVESYGQTAVVSTVAFSGAHADTAWERFTPHGPMALLPLPPHDGSARAGLIWTRPAGEADALTALDDRAFLDKLQREFGSSLGRFTRVGERNLYPIALELAEEQVRTALVLLGNVAHTLHPVAGQGFNLAFRNALHLAATLTGAVRDGGHPGDYGVLAAYLARIERDQQRTIAFSHNLTKLFSSNRAPLVWLRKAGLLGIDLLPPLKQTLNRQAMGLAGSGVRLEP